VASGIDHAVGSAADQVAEDGQKLEEDGGRVGLGVGSDGADGESCETVESGIAQLEGCEWSGRGCARWFRRRCRVRFPRRWEVGIGFRRLCVLFGLKLRQKSEQFGSASLYIGESGHEWPTGAGA
jgi:hypothetical protein